MSSSFYFNKHKKKLWWIFVIFSPFCLEDSNGKSLVLVSIFCLLQKKSHSLKTSQKTTLLELPVTNICSIKWKKQEKTYWNSSNFGEKFIFPFECHTSTAKIKTTKLNVYYTNTHTSTEPWQNATEWILSFFVWLRQREWIIHKFGICALPLNHIGQPIASVARTTTCTENLSHFMLDRCVQLLYLIGFVTLFFCIHALTFTWL